MIEIVSRCIMLSASLRSALSSTLCVLLSALASPFGKLR
jgi:hypothetical protein